MNFTNTSTSKFYKDIFEVQPSKISTRVIGHIKAYAANTVRGQFQSKNMQRVSIVTKLGDQYTNNSFFGIYCGRSESDKDQLDVNLTEYMRDTLHKKIVNEPSYSRNTIGAVQKSIEEANFEGIMKTCEASPLLLAVIKEQQCIVVSSVAANGP